MVYVKVLSFGYADVVWVTAFFSFIYSLVLFRRVVPFLGCCAVNHISIQYSHASGMTIVSVIKLTFKFNCRSGKCSIIVHDHHAKFAEFSRFYLKIILHVGVPAVSTRKHILLKKECIMLFANCFFSIYTFCCKPMLQI